MPEVLPTINNEPAQGIQALLDTTYLWNPDVANDLIEQINALLEKLEGVTGSIPPYSELKAPVSQYQPCYNGNNVYVAAADIETLPTEFDPAQWILIATKAPVLQAGAGIDINGNEISVEPQVLSGASAGATAVQPGSLATVATSGSYNDLSDKPTLGTAAAADTTDFATAAQGALADTAVQPADLATVATSGDYTDLSNKPQINGVTLSGDKTSDELGITTPKYLSVERLNAYVYKATFDTIPEYDPIIAAPVIGNCTSFVRDGKLYRNFDWKYDNRASFMIICKDFQGMAYINGLNDGALDIKKVEQLPYHLVDGINSDGIMVSTHVLYNDWTYAGAGDKDQDIMLLPYYILKNLHSIADISTVLANYVANIKIPEALANAEYLLQFVVTDGTTTYCVMPPASATGSYVIQDITSNPKLTNFRWVSDVTVVRTNLQTRPTGVERWNEIATSDLEDLRFTKCYEAATRLSEFIGIDETTKDSTDAELTAIYDLAHAAYQTRTRDGNLWQTVHSVVYGDGIEHLWCQEDFNKDYCASGGLPDQTGNAGKFLTTDGTNASWGNALQNTATGTNALTILGTATTAGGAVNIGNGSSASGQYSASYGKSATAVGWGALALGTGSVTGGQETIAIGSGSNASGTRSIACGSGATASGSYSIQVGPGTNSDANTFKVGNNNSNFEIMSADGTIPEARLADTTSATQGQVLTLDSNNNAIWADVDSLPSQSGHSGEFLTTDGTNASWSNKVVVDSGNKTVSNGCYAIFNGTSRGQYGSIAVGGEATGTESVTVGGSSTGGLATSVAGRATGGNSVAFGRYANATAYYSTVIGTSAEVQSGSDYGIVIGYGARLDYNKAHAIQIGSTGSYTYNPDANTMKVANANGNFEMMSADGTIPTARLTKVNDTITLTAAGWSNGSQTVTVSGVTSTSVVLVAPDPTDQSAYTSAGILCTAQAANSLTFTATTTPTADIDVNVVCL